MKKPFACLKQLSNVNFFAETRVAYIFYPFLFLPYGYGCLNFMNLVLQPLTHAPFVWNDVLPTGFRGWRLPGGKLLSATAGFGTLCIQEFETSQYSVQFNVFDIVERVILRSVSPEKGLYARLILKGRADCQVNDQTQPLRQNQFRVEYAEGIDISVGYDEKLHYSFDTFFSHEMLHEVLPLFPDLQMSGTIPFVCYAKRADPETLEIVHSIMHCKYDEQLRRHFFDNRVRDLLIHYLSQASEKPPAEKEATKKEIESVYEAERIISSDVSTHIPIPELSRKVLLNEFRFKKIFKHVFGMGPYEYLVGRRMEKGKELLQTGLSVKETAARVGYRASDFTTVFRLHFGFTPGSIKKRDL